jgi:hypothetical protein
MEKITKVIINEKENIIFKYLNDTSYIIILERLPLRLSLGQLIKSKTQDKYIFNYSDLFLNGDYVKVISRFLESING